ncbi:MAG: glutathione S-transferase family protein [Pseudomonadota bacterium]
MFLWSGLLSPFSAKVRIYLAERGIHYELRDIPWTRQHLWGTKPTDFLAVSPRAEVPVLVDEDLAVFDSTVIWQYLEDKYPEQGLLPTDLTTRMQCRLWEDQADHMMAQPLVVLIREVFLQANTDADASAALAAEAYQDFNKYYSSLDAALENKDYLCDTFSMADIATFVCLMFSQTLGATVAADHTHLHQWLQRMTERPAVAQEVEAVIAGAAAA